MSFITNITAAVPTTGSFTDGYPTAVDNDHGNIRAGGVIAESTKFSSSALGEGNPIVRLVSGVNNVVANSTPGSVWNQFSQLGDIVKVTTSIGGVTNNALLTGGSDSAQGDAIHQAGTMRIRLYKTAIRAGDWNDYSGWSSNPTVPYSGGWDIAASVDDATTLKASKTDDAANPTSTEPGELQYDLGQVPVQTGYHPRYLW